MYKSFISKLLAVSLTIFINAAVMVSAQTTDGQRPKEATTPLVTSSTTSNSQGEPLLLLLLGLAVFVGATTVKRKKSSVR